MPLTRDTKLAQYEVVEAIGAGGMGGPWPAKFYFENLAPRAEQRQCCHVMAASMTPRVERASPSLQDSR